MKYLTWGSHAGARSHRGDFAITRRIAVINEKGGSCKTTLVSSVGHWLALQGHRVLAVDLDPQGQLGKVLGVDVAAQRRTALDMLLDAVIGDDGEPAGLPIVAVRENLDLVVSNKSLALFPEKGGGGESHDALRNALDPVDDYDFVLVDAPPTFSSITLNALVAVSEIVIPVPLTYLALDGAAEMVRSIEMVRSRYDHPALAITLVVPTFARRTKLAREIHDKLEEHFKGCISQAVLGYSVLIDEAQSRGQTIFEYAPRSTAARWMASVGRELVDACPARRAA